MMKKNGWWLLGLGAVVLYPVFSIAQVQLITPDEARKPDGMYGKLANTRSITRKPSIQFESPQLVDAEGFPLKVSFVARGGAMIDMKSLRVEYLKEPPIDLTSRLVRHFRANSIEITQAQVPPGKHLLRFTIADSENRESVRVIELEAN